MSHRFARAAVLVPAIAVFAIAAGEACSNFTGEEPPADGAADVPIVPETGTGVDAGVDAPTEASPSDCDPEGDFGPPIPISELSSVSQESFGTLDETESVLVFMSDRVKTNAYDIYESKRDPMTGKLGDPALVREGENGPLGINLTAGQEVEPSVTRDGLLLLLHRTANTSGAPNGFLVARRTTKTADFGPAQTAWRVGVTPAPDLGIVKYPSFAPDGTGFYYTHYASIDGGVGSLGRIRRATSMPSVNGYDQGTDITELIGPDGNGEEQPVVNANETRIFYQSTRSAPGEGGPSPIRRAWTARRASKEEPWGQPRLAAGIVGGPVSWVSVDGCRVYMHVNGQISVARRKPKL